MVGEDAPAAGRAGRRVVRAIGAVFVAAVIATVGFLGTYDARRDPPSTAPTGGTEDGVGS